MRYFAFLKAINVGGHTVTMERLRAIFVELGATDAETFIASGNVTFHWRAKATGALKTRLSAGLAKALGYPVPVFLRSANELAAIAAYRPFPAKVAATAMVTNVGFMAAPLGATAIAALRGYNTQMDHFHSHRREFYWLSRTKQSDSPFFKVKFQRTFGEDITFRNMNTVHRLVEKYLAD